MQKIVSLGAMLMLLVHATSFAQEGDAVDLLEMSLDELLNMEVSSVSKKAESMMDVASSVYVITDEDIRRSGATRLTEVLNLAPGAFFADISYLHNINGIRSGANPYSNSLLMLVDGVPVTSPMTAGLSTETFDLPLEQIARIEVIKGPGGTIYGANACTGIINIFTKDARDTEGFTVNLTGESISHMSPFVRYGHKISDDMFISLYGKFTTTAGYNKNPAFEGDNLTVTDTAGQLVTIENAYNSTDTDGKVSIAAGGHLQFALNEKMSSSTKLQLNTLQTKSYETTLINPEPTVLDIESFDLTASERFDMDLSDNHSLFTSMKLRLIRPNSTLEDGGQKSTLFDVEVQDNLVWGMNNFTAGANFRTVNFFKTINFDSDVNFNEENKTEFLYGGFLQDQLVFSDNFNITLGIKGETWTLVSDKLELSPSARMVFKPVEKVTLWGAVSRSLTTPGYIQSDLELRLSEIPQAALISPAQAEIIATTMMGLTPGTPTFIATVAGMSALYNAMAPGTNRLYVALVPGSDVKPTSYINYELGLRTSAIPKVILDLTGYYSSFDDGLSLDPNTDLAQIQQSAVFDSVSVMPLFYTNMFKGRQYGAEFLAKYIPNKYLRLEMSYALYRTESEPLKDEDGDEYDVPNPSTPATPYHIFRVRPYIDLPQWSTYFSANFMYNSERGMGTKYNYATQSPDDAFGEYETESAAEMRLDVSVEKRFLEDKLGVTVWGKNILADEHVAFFTEFIGVGHPKTIHPVYGGSISYKF